MAYKETFLGDGSQTDFAVSFPYLRRAHIGVTVDGVTAAFTWVNDGLLRMNVAPASGTTVEIKRTTQKTPVVTLADGKPIPAATYMLLAQQSLYVSEEAAGGDGAFSALTPVNNLADLDNPDVALQNLGAGVVGMEAIKAATASDLRLAADLASVPIDGAAFGFVAGEAAGANAPTNDAAMVAWMAAGSPAIYLSKGVFEISQTMAHNVNGKALFGVAGQSVFGTPSAADGTVFKWYGAAGGLMYRAAHATTTADLQSPSLFGVTFHGNSLAGIGVSFAGVMKPQADMIHVTGIRDNSTSYAYVFGHNASATGGQVNCCYGGSFGQLTAHVSGAANGFLFTGKAGAAGTGVTFCQFSYLHFTGSNGYSFIFQKGDDNTFLQIGVSRAAGGTNAGVLFNTHGPSLLVWVGNTINNMNLSKTDGSAMSIHVADDRTFDNSIRYNGVDFAPVLTLGGGSVLEDNRWEFLGQTDYAGGWTTKPWANLPPLPNVESADPDVLDFYKEAINTTPTISFGGNSVGVTYGTRSVNYTRVGNFVEYRGTITLTAKGSSTGQMAINTGIPWASTGAGGTSSVIYYANLLTDSIISIGTGNSPTLWKRGAADGFGRFSATALTHADIHDTTRIDFGGSYRVA